MSTKSSRITRIRQIHDAFIHKVSIFFQIYCIVIIGIYMTMFWVKYLWIITSLSGGIMSTRSTRLTRIRQIHHSFFDIVSMPFQIYCIVIIGIYMSMFWVKYLSIITSLSGGIMSSKSSRSTRVRQIHDPYFDIVSMPFQIYCIVIIGIYMTMFWVKYLSIITSLSEDIGWMSMDGSYSMTLYLLNDEW